MKPISLAVAAGVLAAFSGQAQAAAPQGKTDPMVERGRYVVHISGCNDCHTAEYALRGGDVPEAKWLTGDALGWRGPWGTTYAPNLRLYMQSLSESQWLEKARTLNARPPMPWFNLRAMSEPDLRAVYRYVRHLGPAGAPAPGYVPPESNPPQPYVQFPAPPK